MCMPITLSLIRCFDGYRKRSRDRSPAKENGDQDGGKDKERKSLKDVEDGEVD